MLKLLICLVAAFLIAGVLLHLRHERMEINYRINQAHRRLQALQVELWNQQLQMAISTSPAAVQKAVGEHKLKLVPASPMAKVNTDE
ncbi:MAG: hypothetical protein QM754_09690 [Tepidisphaeraceae bacterium]